MSGLIDQAERIRFVQEREKNISVIAPAGVGKTRSMIERIVHLAQQPDAETVLPRLIVVTYSVRAAQEMQQRARVAIREAAVTAKVQRAFQQTFFGTIHSYCVRLLESSGIISACPQRSRCFRTTTNYGTVSCSAASGRGVPPKPTCATCSISTLLKNSMRWDGRLHPVRSTK